MEDLFQRPQRGRRRPSAGLGGHRLRLRGRGRLSRIEASEIIDDSPRGFFIGPVAGSEGSAGVRMLDMLEESNDLHKV